ncbi:MAG: SDR family NAD(P)-dependent oxidoreductase [Myxococcota bacterium]
MTQRNVLITGAGGGLGLGVTEAFADAGDAVTAVAFAPGEADALAALGWSNVSVVEADARDVAAMEAVVAGLSRVDALVHLAGGFGMGDTAAFDVAEYQRLVEINLTTTFATVRAVLPAMRREGHGRIVTVASRSAIEPPAQMAVYAATKAAVLAFTRAVAEEHRGVDITANSVLPTIIDTPANRAAMGDEGADAWVTPASLAKTLRFLASPDAGDLRGSALQTYGGV